MGGEEPGAEAGGLGAAGPQRIATEESLTGELPVLTRSYDLSKWLLLRVEGFPRSLRFTLGDRIASAALNVHLLLLEAAYVRSKRELLQAASMELKRVQALIRMAKDVRAISVKQYEYASRCSIDVGAQVGGWLKSQR